MRLAKSIGLASVGSLCALAICTLALPGFVLGTDLPPMSGDQSGGVAAPSRGSLPGGASPAKTPSQASVNQTEPAVEVTALPVNGDLLVTLPWGSGAGEVGLLEPSEGLARGPEALSVAPDGRIAVLDCVNGRLMLLDPTGRQLGTAPIPLSVPRFLAVDDDRLYVLDCDVDRRLVVFDWNGMDMGGVALPELDDVVTGLFATERGPCVEVAREKVLLLAETDGALQASVAPLSEPYRASGRTLAGRPLNQGLGRVTQVTFQPGRNARIKLFDLDRATLKAVQTGDSSPVLAGGRAIDHLVSVDGDGTGGMILGARLLEPEMFGRAELSLALTRLVSAHAGSPGNNGGRDANLPDAGSVKRTGLGPEVVSGAEPAASAVAAPASETPLSATDILFLADSPFAYLGQPYVVAPDGRVFQPWGNEAGYSILVHSSAHAEEVQP